MIYGLNDVVIVARNTKVKHKFSCYTLIGLRVYERIMSEKPPSNKVKNVVSSADHALLEDSYTFLPPSGNSGEASGGTSGGGSTWQDRMVQKYHEGLYKECALADLSRAGQIGLRWRTRQEVLEGRGERSCGNKRCQNKDDLVTLEVPFSYIERDEAKRELVKLRLCPSCMPLVKSARKSTDTKRDSSSVRKEHAIDDASIANEDSELPSSSSSSSSSLSSGRIRRKQGGMKNERPGRRKKRRRKDHR